MTFNIPNLDPIAVAILVAVGIYSWMHFRKVRTAVERPRSAPEHALAYEAVVEPLRRAKASFKKKFPELATLPATGDIHLVRFGLFNIGRQPLEPERVREPITIRFADGVQILHAGFAESLKTTSPVPAPKTEGNRVVVPAFQIAGGGTVIFNIITRGNGKPAGVDADIQGIATIRQLG